MRKLFVILTLSFIFNTGLKAESFLICDNFKDQKLIFKIEKDLQYIAEYFREYKKFEPVFKENITDTKNHVYWHAAGMKEWKFNKNTSALIVTTTLADKITEKTYTCGRIVDKKKVDEINELLNNGQ